MRVLLLTALLTLSFSSLSFAGQTATKDCAAKSESTERVGKDLNSTKKVKEVKSTKGKSE